MLVLRRLIPAAFRALFRMVFLGLLAALEAGGATLAISYNNTPTGRPLRLPLSPRWRLRFWLDMRLP